MIVLMETFSNTEPFKKYENYKALSLIKEASMQIFSLCFGGFFYHSSLTVAGGTTWKGLREVY